MPCLVIADADGIQDYVFSSHELKFIRGASSIQCLLMDKLEHVARRLNPDNEQSVIRASGGTLIAELPGPPAGEKFSIEAAWLFRERTGGAATVTTAQVPDREPFRDCLQDLIAKLAINKRLRRLSDCVRGGPYSLSCQVCGLYPARKWQPAREHDAGPRALCLPCHLRWEASRTARNELNPGGHPKSFEEIAQKAKPANYLAIVYIDIDRLGKFMSTRSGSKAEYREWSRKITCRLETAVSAAQCAICAPSELLLMGGDEVMVAIPAGRLHAFLRAFHGVYRVEPGGEDLPRFSAGAAIANSHFPITEFRRIAYELVTSAKAIRDADSVDYEIVTTSMVGTIMEDRKRKDNRRRTAKPYKLEEWFAFCEDARNVRKGVPASQVKSLYRIANEGRLQAELEYNYLLTRVGRREGELLRKVIAPGDNSPDTRFWIPGWTPGVECTRAADLVEIQDFIDAA